MNPEITIIIGTRQRLEFLKRCLESLKTLPAGFAEVVVIDAASTDGTREFLSAQNEISHIFEDRPSGQAAGLNLAARKGTAPFLCWLSDDNRLRPGVLEKAVSLLRKDTAIGLVGLRVKDACGSFSPYPFIGGVSDAGVITCNQGVVRRDIFDQIGGFDEELRDYLIDSDITTKVLLGGKDVVHLREIAVDHDRERGEQSWMSIQNRKAQTKRNTRIYVERYGELVRAAYEQVMDSRVKIQRELWSRLRQREVSSRFGHAQGGLAEFYRTHILYAKSLCVSPEDIDPPGEDWSLRQSLRSLPVPSQSAEFSLSQFAEARRFMIQRATANFEILGFLHARVGKVFLAAGLLWVLKIFAKLSANKERFFHFVQWVTDLPFEVCRYMLDLLIPNIPKFMRADAAARPGSDVKEKSS